MTFLRQCWLVLLLLVAGCDDRQATGGAAPKSGGDDVKRWNVEWNAVDAATGYCVRFNGQTLETKATSIVVASKSGEVLECWATDGGIRSAASKIVLGN